MPFSVPRSALLLAGVALAPLLPVCSAAAAADSAPAPIANSVADEAGQDHVFDIKSAPIARSLNNFAKQAGISIARPRLSYRDGRAKPLTGTYSLKEGLERLLDGTRFGFEIISPASVRIYKKRQKPRSTKSTAPIRFERPVEEIMVSTLRRVDGVQKLPYSITAISGTQQQQFKAVTTGDILHRIPGIYATKRGEGQNKIIIRGLSDGAFTGRAQSLVSTYFDYTRAAYNAPDPSLRLYDIESVEVLRGPQGTLYGSGSLGGLYRVVSRKPSMTEAEFNVSAGYAWTKEGAASKELAGVVNVPVSPEKFAIRAVGYVDDRGGYVDDERLNRNDVNKHQTWGTRISTAMQLSDSWKLTLGFNVQEHESGDNHYYDGDRRRLKRDNFLAEPLNDQFTQFYATFEAEKDWGSLVSSTSWVKRSINQTLDGTRAVEWLVGLEGNFPAPFTRNREIKTFTNETHLSSAPGERFEWLIGSFFASRSEQSLSQLTVNDVQFIVNDIPTSEVYRELLDDQMEEAALFGEFSYFLTDKLSLTAGLRWFYYNDEAVSEYVDIGLAIDNVASGKQKKNGFTPKVVLSYQASDTLLLYAQLSEGYRVGGMNLAGISPLVVNDDDGIITSDDIVFDESRVIDTLDNFQSDTLTNLEIGVKTQSEDGRFTANLSGFHASWRNIQSHQFFEGLPDVDNVGDARIMGAEIDLLFRPTPYLELKAFASLSDSEITATNTRFGAEIGDPLPGAPKYSAGASFQYEFALSSELQATIGADYTYVSAADLLFDKTVTPRNDAYQQANLRVSVRGPRWQLTAYANNLFDNKANVFAFGNPLALAEFDTFTTTNQYTPLRPRTMGLDLSYQF